jgi:hypothetical protein
MKTFKFYVIELKWLPILFQLSSFRFPVSNFVSNKMRHLLPKTNLIVSLSPTLFTVMGTFGFLFFYGFTMFLLWKVRIILESLSHYGLLSHHHIVLHYIGNKRNCVPVTSIDNR